MADPTSKSFFCRTDEMSADNREHLIEIQTAVTNVERLAAKYLRPSQDYDVAIERLKEASMWFGVAMKSAPDPDNTPTGR